jgi:polar amino acid transport system permease protein
MLGSAVVSQISVPDLTYAANFIQSRNFRAFEIYIVVTAIYLFLSIALRMLLNRIGRRLFRGRAPHGAATARRRIRAVRFTWRARSPETRLPTEHAR